MLLWPATVERPISLNLCSSVPLSPCLSAMRVWLATTAFQLCLLLCVFVLPYGGGGGGIDSLTSTHVCRFLSSRDLFSHRVALFSHVALFSLYLYPCTLLLLLLLLL
eukprot:scpid84886/ scgid35675/ 